MNLSRKIIDAKMTSALAVAILLTFGGSVAHANDGVQQINSANQAFVAGKLDEALSQYESAEQAMPGSPWLAYNKGVALYRQGQLDQARQSFATALDVDDPELVAKASFNLGNCHYAAAVQQSESERVAAIESLQTAIAHYRSALQSNPADTDCRANIELAQQLIQKFKQQQEQEQQPQQDQQQQGQEQSENQKSENQESQDQDSENKDSNESEQDQSDQSESQSGKQDEQESDENKSDESKSDENESDENESDENKPDQESKSDESQSEDQSEEEQQSDQNSSGSDSEEQVQKQTDQQNSAVSENEDQQPPDQQPEQQAGQQPQPGEEQQETQPEPKPGQEIQAGTAGEQDQDAGDEQTPGYAVSQPGESGENIDKQEAMKMLQAIRDRDLMRRMQKLNEARRSHQPVDRDW